MREEAVVVTKEGGKGKESARLNRWIVCCSWVRTWWRVRRRGSWGGSEEACGTGSVSVPGVGKASGATLRI